MKNFTLTLIFRKRLPQFNSIEAVFIEMMEQLKKQIEVQKVEMPLSGADPCSVYRNIQYVKWNKTEVNHITGHNNYAALALGRNGILTIHDIGSTFYGNFLHKLYIKIFWFWLPALIIKKITVISDFSKQELSRLIPFAKNKIVVIHNPVNSALQYRPKSFNVSNPLVLHIGTKSNKNLERTIEALDGIKCRFLVIGELSLKQVELLEKHKID